MIEKYKNSWRTITADNFFSSIPLVKKLLEYALLFVGTLRKDKPQIPYEFRKTQVKINNYIYYQVIKGLVKQATMPNNKLFREFLYLRCMFYDNFFEYYSYDIKVLKLDSINLPCFYASFDSFKATLNLYIITILLKKCLVASKFYLSLSNLVWSKPYLTQVWSRNCVCLVVGLTLTLVFGIIVCLTKPVINRKN